MSEEPSANLHDPVVLAAALQIAHEQMPPNPSAGVVVPDPSEAQRLRDAANEAESGPRAAELHQAADEAEATTAVVEAVMRSLANMPGSRDWLHERSRRAVETAWPLIAARVRAEAMERAAPNHVKPSDVVVVGARTTAEGLEVIRDVEWWWTERVRAEERQRITALIERLAPAAGMTHHECGTSDCVWCGCLGFHDAACPWVEARATLAAGSAVPVATPEHPHHVAVHLHREQMDRLRAAIEVPDRDRSAYTDCEVVELAADQLSSAYPVATPTEPAPATTPGGVSIPASVCLTCADQWFECPDCGGTRHRRPAEQDGTEQDGEPLTYDEVVACLADERGDPDWTPPAEQDGQR